MTSTTGPTVVTDTTPALDPQVPESAPAVANAASVVPEATPTGANTPRTAVAPSRATGATVPPSASSSVPPSEGRDQVELLHLLRELLEQQEKNEQPQPPAKPLIGEQSLLVEGFITVRSDDGVVVDIPINALLARALAPGLIQGAQQQFATILDQLVLKPATVEFIEYIGRVEADRQLMH